MSAALLAKSMYGGAGDGRYCEPYIEAVGPISEELDGPGEAWAFFADHPDR